MRCWTRRLVLWIGPALISFLLLLLGFLTWAIATQAGTRWVLRTAIQQVDGQIEGVSGTLWHGIDVDKLAVSLPGVEVDVERLRVAFAWKELLDRRLRGREIAMSRLAVRLELTESEDSSDEPFVFPELPVQLALDRLYIGQLELEAGSELPRLEAAQIDLAAALTNEHAQLFFKDLLVNYEGVHAGLSGEARLLALADPWPFSLNLNVEAHTDKSNPLLCLREYVPDLPPEEPLRSVQGARAGAKAERAHGLPALGQRLGWPGLEKLERGLGLWRPGKPDSGKTPGEQALQPWHPHETGLCTLRLATEATGSLDGLTLKAEGGGQGLSLDLHAEAQPRSKFIVRQASLDLALADGSSLTGDVHWTPKTDKAAGHELDDIQLRLDAKAINLGLLGLADLPQALLTTTVKLDARVRDEKEVLSAGLQVELDPATRWNGQVLEGTINTRLRQAKASNEPRTAAEGLETTLADIRWQDYVADQLDIALALGGDHITSQGGFGAADSQFKLDVAIAHLANFWPGLPGAVGLKAQIDGGLAAHKVQLEGHYAPGDADAHDLGEAPVDLTLGLAGAWQDAHDGRAAGWQGNVSTLVLDHAGLQAQLQSPLALNLVPEAVSPEWQWQAGATTLDVRLPSGYTASINSQAARGGHGRWETRGVIEQLLLTEDLLAEVQALAGLDEAGGKEDRGSIIFADQEQEKSELTQKLAWDLKFADALQGTVSTSRVSGDLMVPGDPPFPLGLQVLDLDIVARPSGPSSSQLGATLKLETQEMGRVSATGSALLHVGPDGGFYFNDSDPKTARVQADVASLGWVSLLAGDDMEFDGSLQADVQLRSRPDGSWTTAGQIDGQNIKLVRVDDGVRLLDGELSAHFDNDRIILDRLYFPARLRVTPKEWRTAEWVKENPDAQDGGLTLTGSWNLLSSEGGVTIDLHRYPLMQRTDRHAMVSGAIQVEVPFPKVEVTGEITVDAGWVDLDMVSSVPSLDSDVVVLRAGQEEEDETESPMDISLDLSVNLGPRFYITGFGLDSGLVGDLRIMMNEGNLRGVGVLRTRGGAIEAYGQRLRLREGSITFQGDLTNPVLHIEALRTGLQVEAGVAVLGTARKPHIDLISYPSVSDVQKLSWLLLGHGPDDSGGDAMLLFSVGASFLSDGEPFYRKFGIDELSLETGELGSTGSILPPESVVSGLATGTSLIEQQFVLASKSLGRGFTLSIEQALSDTGTVGRASYRLMRGLTAELSVGTVNGLALIYRRLFW